MVHSGMWKHEKEKSRATCKTLCGTKTTCARQKGKTLKQVMCNLKKKFLEVEVGSVSFGDFLFLRLFFKKRLKKR